VVLYGSETWSPTLREEHRLKEFQNRVLRRIFEPKKNEVTGGWREPKLVFFAKYNQNAKVKEVGHVARIGTKRNAHRILVGKPKR
jgi:hypothetical protein